jgi:hypothetical protein
MSNFAFLQAELGSRRGMCKMGHFVNKYCKMSFNDLKTCPKMVLKHSSFWILKSTVNTIQSFKLAHL